MIWLAVAVRVFVNPLSNVFQKLLTRDGASPLLVVGVTHALLTLFCLPWLFTQPLPESTEFWVNIGISAVLAIAGNAMLVKAVELSDLSVLGPINSYKAVVSLLPGMILLQEFPPLAALFGIVLIIAGSYFVLDRDPARPGRNLFVRFVSDRGVRYRLAALVISATEAVVLKKALLASSPFPTFAVWSVLGLVVAVPAVRLIDRSGFVDVKSFRANRGRYLLLALTTGLMQYTTIVVFDGLQVASALALFQTSTLVSVLLGWRVFREKNILRRFVGSAVMVAGAILIVLTR